MLARTQVYPTTSRRNVTLGSIIQLHDVTITQMWWVVRRIVLRQNTVLMVLPCPAPSSRPPADPYASRQHINSQFPMPFPGAPGSRGQRTLRRAQVHGVQESLPCCVEHIVVVVVDAVALV